MSAAEKERMSIGARSSGSDGAFQRRGVEAVRDRIGRLPVVGGALRGGRVADRERPEESLAGGGGACCWSSISLRN